MLGGCMRRIAARLADAFGPAKQQPLPPPMAEAVSAARDQREASLLLHAAAVGEPVGLIQPRPEAVDNPISHATALELREDIAVGRVTAGAAVRSFAARSIRVGAALNAVAGDCVADALAGAATIDEATTTHASTAVAGQPLRGIPLSIKDEYQVAGTISTCGVVAKLAEPLNAEDGVLVRLLRSAGALPLVRSTLPQLVMSTETASAVFGTTVNPFDPHRIPGGSSGGEGALIASRCSAAGVGSDIAGSVRLPALACGIVGFKPTPSRVSCAGLEPTAAVATAAGAAAVAAAAAAGRSAAAAGAAAEEAERAGVDAAQRVTAPERSNLSTTVGGRSALAEGSGDQAPDLPEQLPYARTRCEVALRAGGGSRRALGAPLPYSDAPDPCVACLAEGQNLVAGVPGPMGRCVDDLALVMAAWLPQQAEEREEEAQEAAQAASAEQAQAAHGDKRSSRAPAHRAAGQPLGLWDFDAKAARMPFNGAIYRGDAPPPGLMPVSAAATSLGIAGQLQAGGRLRIAFVLDDGGFFEPATACKRAVLEAAAALAAAGHEVVRWDYAARGVDARALTLSYGVLIGADAMDEMRDVLRGEPQDAALYGRFAELGAIPDALGIRDAVAALLDAAGAPRQADIVRATRRRSMYDAWQWNRRRNCAAAALAGGMAEGGVHAIIAPGMATPAWRHGQASDLEWGTCYAWQWNALGWPAGVVPVTRVRGRGFARDASVAAASPGGAANAEADVGSGDECSYYGYGEDGRTAGGNTGTPAASAAQAAATSVPFDASLSLPQLHTLARALLRNDASCLPPYQRDRIAAAAGRAMSGAGGLPVGVHVAALPNHDEVCLRVMRELEAALQAVHARQLDASAGAAAGVPAASSVAAGSQAQPQLQQPQFSPPSLRQRRSKQAAAEEGPAAALQEQAQLQSQQQPHLLFAPGDWGDWNPMRGCPERIVKATVAVQEAAGHGLVAAAARLQRRWLPPAAAPGGSPILGEPAAAAAAGAAHAGAGGASAAAIGPPTAGPSALRSSLHIIATSLQHLD